MFDLSKTDCAILFLPGFHNEIIPNYFKYQKMKLLNLGLKEDQLEHLSLPSKNSIEINAEVVFDSVRKKKKKYSKILLAGHSKGALEGLICFAKNPQEIDHLISLQGVLDGSKLVDILLDRINYNYNSWFDQVLLSRYKKFHKEVLRRTVGLKGLESISHSYIQKNYRQNHDFLKSIEKIQNKITLVCSKITEKEVPWSFVKIVKTLKKNGWESDGVALYNEQRPNYINPHEIIDIPVNHGELVSYYTIFAPEKHIAMDHIVEVIAKRVLAF